MKNESTKAFDAFSTSLLPATSLRSLLNSMIRASEHLMRTNNTTVLNEVPNDIFLTAENDKKRTVLNELLKAVISNSRNSEICVTAERYRDLVILEIQDRNNFNGYALGFSIQSIEPEATSAGGYIHFKEQQKRVATISFSFPN